MPSARQNPELLLEYGVNASTTAEQVEHMGSIQFADNETERAVERLLVLLTKAEGLREHSRKLREASRLIREESTRIAREKILPEIPQPD